MNVNMQCPSHTNVVTVEVASKKKSELFSGTQPLHPDDIVVVLGKQTFAASVIRKLISSNRALQRQCFAMDEFVCNPTKHRLVPKHTRLMIHSAEDKQRFMNKHNIQSLQQLPLIFTTDPIAKWYGMQDGDICTVTRPTYTSHRMVVHNAE